MSKLIVHHNDTGILTILSSTNEPFISMIYECYLTGAMYSTIYNSNAIAMIDRLFESDPMLINLVIENRPTIFDDRANGIFLQFHYIDQKNGKNQGHNIWLRIPVMRSKL